MSSFQTHIHERLSPTSIRDVLLVVSCIIIVIFVISPLFLSKLSRFPGPLWAKLSPLWLTYQSRLVRRSEKVLEQHHKYGDFVRIAPNHISINVPGAYAEVYSHKYNFIKGPWYEAFMQGPEGVFNTRNPSVNSRKRRYLKPAFSQKALDDFEPYMSAELLTWKNQMLGMVDQKPIAEVDFVRWTNFLAYDAISSFSFGESFGFCAKGYDHLDLISTIERRGELINALGTLPRWLRPLLKHNWFDSFSYSGVKKTASFGQIGMAAYQRRKGKADSRKDLLSHMFLARDPDTQDPLPEAEIIAEATGFIAGGSDSTAATMAHFIDIVSRDPPLQKRIQTEIDEAFPGMPDEKWVASAQGAERVPLLVATLREVFRVRPAAAAGFERLVPQGGKTIGGVFIPGGTIVSVPINGVLSDPRIFENPREFNPDRWLAPGAGELMEYFVPFSVGPRACIGRNFAWMEILKCLATLFKLFNVERATTEPTVMREANFYKSTECCCRISRRGENVLSA